jgi:hypothetical protein
MLSDTERNEIRPLVRSAQIVVGALALGVINFSAVVLFMSLTNHRGEVAPPNLTHAAIIASCFAIIAAFAIPMFIAGAMGQSAANASAQATSLSVARRLANVYFKLLVIRCAILEGAAFFCLVSYMIESNRLSMVVASILLIILLMQFPTTSRVEDRIETQLANLRQLVQFT